jgi:C1A family cysteine protease
MAEADAFSYGGAAMPQLSKRSIKYYGWVRDLPDHRDVLYAAPMAIMTALPSTVDLRPQFPVPAYDQGELGSCTGNAIAAAVEFARLKAHENPDFVPARLFIYYNERTIEGTVNQDSGAQIRDGMKAVAKLGVCPEASKPPQAYDWPYEISMFTAPPPAACFQFGAKCLITSYRRLPQLLAQMRACLASGFPFVFGFSVYESFESDIVKQTGIVNLPTANEQLLGGHAVLAMGYDDKEQRFTVRNSWGPDWGQNGYFTMPYAYLTDAHLASDFWTVSLVEE